MNGVAAYGHWGRPLLAFPAERGDAGAFERRGMLGPLGDMFESVVKRDAGTKDAGTLFGAHGGALDRLDAAMFTVVVGYYVWLAVQH